jgi:hypothetical protein
MVVLFILIAVGMAAIWGMILQKAGYNPWLGVLFPIPLVNILAFLWFAFAEWPSLNRD